MTTVKLSWSSTLFDCEANLCRHSYNWIWICNGICILQCFSVSAFEISLRKKKKHHIINFVIISLRLIMEKKTGRKAAEWSGLRHQHLFTSEKTLWCWLSLIIFAICSHARTHFTCFSLQKRIYIDYICKNICRMHDDVCKNIMIMMMFWFIQWCQCICQYGHHWCVSCGVVFAHN